MLDETDLDSFKASDEVKNTILGFQKRLARSSPLNDRFIEDIGRLTFVYKEVEKKDFGLAVADLLTLDEAVFNELTLELPEFEGLGDVDIRLYRKL